MRTYISLLFILLIVLSAAAQPKTRWFRGNLHTHTLNSDGDAAPDDVVKWYRENGYNFVVITDHEYITKVDILNQLYAVDQKFLVIQGQEVTDRLGSKPLHVNAFGLERVVMPQGGETVAQTYQHDVDAIRAAGGVPHINHPNFGWAATADDLLKVKNFALMEIFSGHPLVNSLGGGGVPSHENIWDTLLTAGIKVFGTAVDDSHHYRRPADRTAARPGQAWVVVRSETLSQSAIISALSRGDFYASTGVELLDIQANEKTYTVTIKEERWSKYRIQFIGSGGRILSEAVSSPAVYNIKGDERYVRAKIIESNGKLAWTQPVFVGKQ